MADAIKILIVEDVMTQALILKRLVESSRKYAAKIARSSRNALEQLQAEQFDAVLTDVTLPEMNGYELCRAIKSNPETAKVAVVLLVSMLERSNILDILHSGADNFVLKAFDDEYLLNRIHDVVANAVLRSGQRDDSRSWNGVYEGRMVSATVNPGRIVDMLLCSYATNVHLLRASMKGGSD